MKTNFSLKPNVDRVCIEKSDVPFASNNNILSQFGRQSF